MQPFNWRLPVMVVHLTKSLTGHQTLNEFYAIKNILSIINNHEHFSVHFLAADGEIALNLLHKEALIRYQPYIDRAVKGRLSINCFIIPVLDILHGVKTGRNKVMSDEVKLGNGRDVFNYESLLKDLNIKSNVFKDKSTASRMKDMYALILFSINNALIEFEKEKYSNGFYLLIYSIIIEIFRNTYINLDL